MMHVRLVNKTELPIGIGDEVAIDVVAQIAPGAILGSLRLRFSIDPERFGILDVVPVKMDDWIPVMNLKDQDAGALVIGGYSLHGVAAQFVPFRIRLVARASAFSEEIAPTVEECFTQMAVALSSSVDPVTVTVA